MAGPMRASDRGAVAHVFLAIAVSLPLLLAAGSIALGVIADDQTPLNVWLLVLLAAAFVAVVVWSALLPLVRPVEVATARTLLGVDLADVRHPQAWDSRLRGARWLAVLAGFGIVLTVALIYLIPLSVGLLAHPISGSAKLEWPGAALTWHTGTGWRALWVTAIGAIIAVLTVLLVVWAGRLLQRLAPRLLGPTLVEQVAERAERERDLARANALAREVHDGIGHTLTAMTLQVTAARRLLRSDPDAADRSLAAVEDLGRRAQADVDDVVGALRTGSDDPTPLPDEQDVVPAVGALLAESPLRLEVDLPRAAELPGAIAETTTQVVREALTNAARHGTGSARVCVRRRAADVLVEVTNDVPDGATRTPGRRGLVGLRERVLLVGGTLTAEPEGEGRWTLRATLPTT